MLHKSSFQASHHQVLAFPLPSLFLTNFSSSAAMVTAHYRGVKNEMTVVQEDDKFTIKAPALDIVWGGDQRYWMVPDQQGWATLVQVSWLQVTGSLDCQRLSRQPAYSVTFRMSLKPDAFGWSDSPAYFILGCGNKIIAVNTAILGGTSYRPGEIFEGPKMKVTRAELTARGVLQFGMYEIWSGRWKGGLVIHEVVIQPTRG